MALTHITDHEARALARVIHKYRESTGLKGLISADTAEIQTLENVFWDMFQDSIDDAEGAQLDVYGKYVGQPREGRSDSVYRLWIRTRVIINKSSGTGKQIVNILTALVAGTTFIRFKEQFPAAFEVHMGYTPALDWAEATKILQKCKVGGVRALLVVDGASESEMLHLDSTDGPGLDVGCLSDYWE